MRKILCCDLDDTDRNPVIQIAAKDPFVCDAVDGNDLFRLAILGTFP